MDRGQLRTKETLVRAHQFSVASTQTFSKKWGQCGLVTTAPVLNTSVFFLLKHPVIALALLATEHASKPHART